MDEEIKQGIPITPPAQEKPVSVLAKRNEALRYATPRWRDTQAKTVEATGQFGPENPRVNQLREAANVWEAARDQAIDGYFGMLITLLEGEAREMEARIAQMQQTLETTTFPDDDNFRIYTQRVKNFQPQYRGETDPVKRQSLADKIEKARKSREEKTQRGRTMTERNRLKTELQALERTRQILEAPTTG